MHFHLFSFVFENESSDIHTFFSHREEAKNGARSHAGNFVLSFSETIKYTLPSVVPDIAI